jgi:hypothetical protein
MAEVYRIGGSAIKWDGKAVEEKVAAIARRRVLAAANYLQVTTQVNVGESGWQPDGSYKPSKPGQFPHLKTGTMRANIYRDGPAKTGDIEARVGVNVDYGVDHELGDRPFLRRTAIEEESTLRKILEGKHSGSVFSQSPPASPGGGTEQE